MVGAAFLVLFLTYGVQYSFGIFFTALTAEFGWSRASLSGVFSLYAGTYSFLGLFAGRLTDRWGPRRVIALGGLLLGGGLALSGTVRSLLPLYGTYLLAAAGMSTAYVPCTATVARWFTARRGAAVGLAMAGAGVGIFACPPLVGWLVEQAGWRLGYVAVGGALAGLLALLALALRVPPRAPGRASGAEAVRPVVGPPGWLLREPAVQGVVAVYVCTWMPVFMPLVHLVPLARDLGLDPAVGATALSVLGAGSLVGRAGMGALSDRIGRRPALAASLGLEAAGFAGLALAGGAAGLFLAAGVYGFAYGATTVLMPALVTDLFGPARAARLVGIVFSAAGTPAAVGPIVGGLAFDLTGSYAPAFAAGAGLNALALVILARAVRPPAATGA